MGIKINCMFNDSGAWCKCERVKRSLFGLGARCCVLYPGVRGDGCAYQVKYQRPALPKIQKTVSSN